MSGSVKGRRRHDGPRLQLVVSNENPEPRPWTFPIPLYVILTDEEYERRYGPDPEPTAEPLPEQLTLPGF